jgi:hypothetical protein
MALTYSLLETNEGLVMNTCVLRPTPGYIESIHEPVPQKDIQDKVETVRLPFAMFMLPHIIVYFHALTKSTNDSPHLLLIL